jgi:hypothetical protein
MVRPIAVAVLALSAIAVIPDSANAQRKGLVDVSPPHYRNGLWLEGALGWGEESYKFANDPYSAGLSKPTFGLRMGGTLGPHFRLGAEWNIWWNNYQEIDGDGLPVDVNETLNAVMAIGRLYPAKSLGLFVKGGVGLGITHAGVEFGNATTETGFVSSLGAGWEIKLSRNLFFTPAVDWYQHSFEKRDDDTLYERLFNVSIGVTWQPGR